MCALVVLNVAGCSWPPTSRSTRSTSTEQGRPRVNFQTPRVSLLPILKRGFLLSSETKERILVVGPDLGFEPPHLRSAHPTVHNSLETRGFDPRRRVWVREVDCVAVHERSPAPTSKNH